MAASDNLRWPWLWLTLLAAGCAAPPQPGAVPSDAALKERRYSESDPRFAGKPFDFRCGDCELMIGSNGCESIPRAPLIVRVTAVQQRLLENRCDPSEHDFSARCIAEIELDLEDAEVVVPAGKASPPATVAAEFSYASPPSDVPRIADRQARYLFLRPKGQSTSPATHDVLAMCPGFNQP